MLYDFANTAFSAMYVTVFFPFLIKALFGAPEYVVGLTFGLSMLAVGFLVPLIGVFCDITGRKTMILFSFTLLCIVSMILTPYFGLAFAVFCGFVANFAYHSCLVVYNSFLPDISKKNRGMTSGQGVSLGYFGTLASILVVFLAAGKIGLESPLGVTYAILATAAFFFVFSIPLFVVFWHEKTRVFSLSVQATIKEVASTAVSLPKDREVWYLLCGSFYYSNAISAAIIFLGLYARQEVHMSIPAFLFGVYPALAIAAAIGAFMAGPLSDNYGPRKVMISSGVVWILSLILMIYSIDDSSIFTIGACLGGAGMGAIWTARRPLLLDLAPGRKVGEYFGFEELSDKFSGVLGPIIFGFIAGSSLGYSYALVSLAFFFAGGIYCFVRLRKDDPNIYS